MDIYTDADGIEWRAVARIPYSELTAGQRYALRGEAGVYVCGGNLPPIMHRAAPGDGLLRRILTGLRHTTVILLERT